MKVFLYLTVIFCLFDIMQAQNGVSVGYLNRNLRFESIDTMYRRPTDKELKLVAVDPELVEKHKDFLSNDKTGILRLMPDLGCNENKNIVVAKEDCLKYSMPGAGSAFSFRRNRYRLWRLADLVYKKGIFFSGSRYTQGIIGFLGNADLNDVSINSRGVKELRDYLPSRNYKDIEQEYKAIERGVIVNGIPFSNRLKIKEGNTYVLRSIAYRGKSYISVAPRITYDEFEFDKRLDILVILRVLKKDKDESITILWKELERKDSPKITFPKEKIEN